MLITDYPATLRMADGRTPYLEDYEVDLIVSIEGSGDDATVSVDDVLVEVTGRDGKVKVSMLTNSLASPLMAQLGREIQEAAEADPWVHSKAFEDADFYFVGGPNNPDGFYRRVS